MIRLNGLLAFFLFSFVAAALVAHVLRLLNIRHLRRHGSDVPEVLAGEIDAGTLSRGVSYASEHLLLSALEDLVEDAALLALLLGGALPGLVGLLPPWEGNFLTAGLLFFAVLGLAGSLLGMPFDLYRTFVIERRYGFSTITVGLWLSDRLKGAAIAAVLGGALFGVVLLLLQTTRLWWLWTWLAFVLFELLLLWLYPIAIAPLFNRYEPVAEDALKAELAGLMAKAGLQTEGVYQADAGRRSRHTNAYFTGLGRTKRIILYDTLLASHPRIEVAAILAHEIGHWQKKHLLWQLGAVGGLSLLFLWLASRLVAWPLLYETFGFEKPVPFVGLLMAWVVLRPLATFVTPLLSALARRLEKEADEAAARLMGGGRPLASALKRLCRENLADLHPHPLYARFYYRHPPAVERISRLLKDRPS